MNNTQFFIISLVTALILATVGCSDSPEKTTPAPADQQLMSQGFQLLETNCFSCHSPDAGIDNRIAPPMIAIKKHYINDDISKKDFTKDLIAFVQNPSEEKSKMPGALKKFGLMPKMSFSEEQLTAMAEYIYTAELEKPDWFDKHYQSERKKHLSENSDAELSFKELGLKRAMATKAVLGKNLLGAINKNGTDAALEFCNAKAFTLTDSMSAVLKTDIKRVSDRPRNPANAAGDAELEYIFKTKELLKNGQKPQPQTQIIGGKQVGYYPIVTNKMCLQCHGQPESEIKPSTLEKINLLYPKDSAKGYGPNELRGIWVIKEQ